MKGRIKIKMNGGSPVVLCSICNTIMRGALTKDEKLPPQYCRKCLQDIVYKWKTKYEEGFIQEEQEELIKRFPNININKYNEAMRGNTCMMRDEQIIIYHCDIYKALLCGIENRGLTQAEWD
jgi:hypothetical protein